MSIFKPQTFNVPFFILKPKITKEKGVRVKTFEKIEDVYWCSFRTFGGTEKQINDVTVVEDTAVIETYFDPMIAADCNIEVDGKVYEILGTPENINMRNQYMKFKVRAVEGGA